ncbi:hypothetical protein J1N35_012061, partial [Gossypium stocksii]
MYAFHENGRHTEDCSSLKDAIEEAVRNCELKDFVAQHDNQPKQSSRIEAK